MFRATAELSEIRIEAVRRSGMCSCSAYRFYPRLCMQSFRPWKSASHISWHPSSTKKVGEGEPCSSAESCRRRSLNTPRSLLCTSPPVSSSLRSPWQVPSVSCATRFSWGPHLLLSDSVAMWSRTRQHEVYPSGGRTQKGFPSAQLSWAMSQYRVAKFKLTRRTGRFCRQSPFQARSRPFRAHTPGGR